MKKRDIQADILSVLSDGKIWSMGRIAEEIEVSYKTVYRHIHALAYRFNIIIFCGGVKKGGVQLLEKKVCIDMLTKEELEHIIVSLSIVRKESKNIEHFVYCLSKFIE